VLTVVEAKMANTIAYNIIRAAGSMNE